MTPPFRQASKSAKIIATGMTKLSGNGQKTPSMLMQEALGLACSSANIQIRDLKGLIAVPSLAESHFMEAHYLATQMKLLPGKGILTKTIDTGGAGPISALLEAKRMILME
ncbi:hypothetical protein HDU91_000758, partial [Kappamyces sp. JEL0680]